MNRYAKLALGLSACVSTAVVSSDTPQSHETLSEFVVEELQGGVPIPGDQPAGMFKLISASAVLEDYCKPSDESRSQLEFLAAGPASEVYLQISAVVLDAVSSNPGMCDFPRVTINS